MPAKLRLFELHHIPGRHSEDMHRISGFLWGQFTENGFCAQLIQRCYDQKIRPVRQQVLCELQICSGFTPYHFLILAFLS